MTDYSVTIQLNIANNSSRAYTVYEATTSRPIQHKLLSKIKPGEVTKIPITFNQKNYPFTKTIAFTSTNSLYPDLKLKIDLYLLTEGKQSFAVALDIPSDMSWDISDAAASIDADLTKTEKDDYKIKLTINEKLNESTFELAGTRK